MGTVIPTSNEAFHHFCKVFIHWLQTSLKHFFCGMTFAVRQANDKLFSAVSWSVMTWRQTESLSVQLCNLITTARGGPCISNVHLSAILELHPSFLSLFFVFKPKDERKPWFEDSWGLSSVCRFFILTLRRHCCQSFQRTMFTLSKSCFQSWGIVLC